MMTAELQPSPDVGLYNSVMQAFPSVKSYLAATELLQLYLCSYKESSGLRCKIKRRELNWQPALATWSVQAACVLGSLSRSDSSNRSNEAIVY